MKIKLVFSLAILSVILLYNTPSYSKKMEGDESIFKVDTFSIKNNVTNYTEEIEKAIGMGIVGRARENLKQLNQLIEAHKNIFTKDERKKIVSKLKNYETKVLEKEDALVAIADSLIKQFKLEEAQNFLQKKLMIVGIDEKKIQKLEKQLIDAEYD